MQIRHCRIAVGFLMALAAARPGAFLFAQDQAPAPAPVDSLGPGFEANLSGVLEGVRAARQARPLGTIRPEDALGHGEPIRIVSWNLMNFGDGIAVERLKAYKSILEHMFTDSRSAKVLAVQELGSKERGAEKFGDLLPGKEGRWNIGFGDTDDFQDNGFFTRKGIVVNCQKTLFKEGSAKSWHPARLGHMRAGNFDFTMVTVHLAFGKDQPGRTQREMKYVLDWLKEYLADPKNDPDVIITGDFNLPTRKGKEGSRRSSQGKWTPIEDIIDEYPEFRSETEANGNGVRKPTALYALVDDQTSRADGEPANNYDHFLLTGDAFDEEYVEGSAGMIPPKFIHRVEGSRDVVVSDHYPITARFRSGGPGNNGKVILPDGPGPVCEE